MPSRLPWFAFHPQDWLADPGLILCSLAAQGAWIRLLSIAWNLPQRGVFADAAGPMSLDRMAALLCVDRETGKAAVAELIANGVCSQREDGAYYSRRMVRDDQNRIESGGRMRRLRSRYADVTRNKTVTVTEMSQGESESESESEMMSTSSVRAADAADDDWPVDLLQTNKAPIWNISSARMNKWRAWCRQAGQQRAENAIRKAMGALQRGKAIGDFIAYALASDATEIAATASQDDKPKDPKVEAMMERFFPKHSKEGAQ